MRISLSHILIVGLSFVIVQSSFSGVTTYTNKTQWETAAGSYNTINFTEYPANTLITDQYADLGVHFTDGIDLIYYNQNVFADNYGLNGAFDETTLEFDAPMTTIAIDFPGTAAFQLYSDGELIYSIPFVGGSGTGHFVGIIATEPFDEVLMYDPFTGLSVDTLYFGPPPIPAPSALALLGLAGLLTRSRRRSQ